MSTINLQYNYFDLTIPVAIANDVYHIGQCYADTCEALSQVDFSHVTDESLVKQLLEYGGWEEYELTSRHQNEIKMLWIACGDYV